MEYTLASSNIMCSILGRRRRRSHGVCYASSLSHAIHCRIPTSRHQSGGDLIGMPSNVSGLAARPLLSTVLWTFRRRKGAGVAPEAIAPGNSRCAHSPTLVESTSWLSRRRHRLPPPRQTRPTPPYRPAIRNTSLHHAVFTLPHLPACVADIYAGTATARELVYAKTRACLVDRLNGRYKDVITCCQDAEVGVLRIFCRSSVLLGICILVPARSLLSLLWCRLVQHCLRHGDLGGRIRGVSREHRVVLSESRWKRRYWKVSMADGGHRQCSAWPSTVLPRQ